MVTAGPSGEIVVDSHHHFWDIYKRDYAWMPEGVLKRNYLPGDMRPLLEKSGVSRTVVVQADQSVEETGWLLDLSDANDFIAGVVGWVDLRSPDVGKVLDDLLTRPGLVGIRHVVHDEPDDDWLLRPDVVRGLRELARRGLAYDLLVRPQHLEYVSPLLDKVPDLRMVVDHMGKPLIASGAMEPWASEMAEVAALPGVYCKVSGMVTEADLASWSVEDLKPYAAHVVEHFGFDRLMFGSDWPVCLLATGYDEVVNAALESVGPISDDQRGGLMGRNAAEFYRLSCEPSGVRAR